MPDASIQHRPGEYQREIPVHHVDIPGVMARKDNRIEWHVSEDDQQNISDIRAQVIADQLKYHADSTFISNDQKRSVD